MVKTKYIITLDDVVLGKFDDQDEALECLYKQIDLLNDERYCKIHKIPRSAVLRMIAVDLPCAVA